MSFKKLTVKFVLSVAISVALLFSLSFASNNWFQPNKQGLIFTEINLGVIGSAVTGLLFVSAFVTFFVAFNAQKFFNELAQIKIDSVERRLDDDCEISKKISCALKDKIREERHNINGLLDPWFTTECPWLARAFLFLLIFVVMTNFNYLVEVWIPYSHQFATFIFCLLSFLTTAILLARFAFFFARLLSSLNKIGSIVDQYWEIVRFTNEHGDLIEALGFPAQQQSLLKIDK